MDLRFGPVAVSLGKQIVAWGTADAYNPTDNFNPYDYLDILDREKIGVYSATATLTTEAVRITLVMAPYFTPSRDPLLGQRWIPPGAAVGGVGESIPLGAQVQGRQVPVSNQQYGIRAKTTLAGWDLSASYFNGAEYLPIVQKGTTSLNGVAVPLFIPVYRHMQVAGFDFATTAGKFEVHGEMAYKFADRPVKDTRFQGSLGVNYTWDELPVSWLEQVIFIVEHNREVFLSSQNPGFIVDGNYINAFRDAYSGRVQLKFTEETQFTVTGTMDLKTAVNYYVQYKLTHKLADDVHVEAGVDTLAGPLDSFWGKWRQNDRFFFMSRYYF